MPCVNGKSGDLSATSCLNSAISDETRVGNAGCVHEPDSELLSNLHSNLVKNKEIISNSLGLCKSKLFELPSSAYTTCKATGDDDFEIHAHDSNYVVPTTLFHNSHDGLKLSDGLAQEHILAGLQLGSNFSQDCRTRTSILQPVLSNADFCKIGTISPSSHCTLTELGIRGCSIFLPMKINNVSVEALIDTGAEVTVISSSFAKKVPQLFSDQHILLRNAEEGAVMLAHFCPDITLSVGHTPYKWHIFEAPIADNLILGQDFIYHHKLDILTSQGVVVVDDNKVEFVAKSKSSSYSFNIKTVWSEESIYIPAWSGITISLKVPTSSSWKIFEPFANDTIYMYNSMIQPTDTEFNVLVLNTSSEGCYIKPNQCLGIISDILDPELLTASDAAVNALHWEPDTGKLSNSTDDYVQSEFNTLIQAVRNISGLCCEDHFPAVDSQQFPEIVTMLPEHLRDLFVRSSTQITLHQSLLLADLLLEFSFIFAKHELDIGCLKEIQHKIKLTSDIAFKQSLRRTPIQFQKEEEDHLNKMLEAGVIRPSASEYASPVCLVRKRCGGVRWTIDFRVLNSLTVKDAFPLPRIGDCIDTLAGTEFYCAVDMCSGYYQIEIAPEDRHKTAFITRFGLFEHTRLAFGLSTAPATFQRVIQLVLRGLIWHEALAFIDDVIVLGSSFDNMLANLKKVLERFAEYNLKLKPKKCVLFQKEVEFLGHLVSKDGVAVKPDHIKLIREWPVPKTKKELESFLGFANYHREHIKGFAEISAPLYALAGASKPGSIKLSEDLVAVVEELKLMLSSPPVLCYPLPEYTFILDCDASNIAIGCELSQEIDGKERVIAYGSFKLTNTQRNYCTTRKELLAVVRFTRQFRHYLLGRQFICRTDHNSLIWLMGFKNIQGQLARWLEELSQYDMVVLHRPGKLHQNADSLSRLPSSLSECDNYREDVQLSELPCFPCDYCERMHLAWERYREEIDYVVPLSVRQISPADDSAGDGVVCNWLPGFTPTQLRDMQLADSNIATVITWLESDHSPTKSELKLKSASTRHYWSIRSQLVWRHKVLFYTWQDAVETRLLLVVPQDLKSKVLFQCHDSNLSGHVGRENTLQNAKKAFYWYSMYQDVAVYVKSCSSCNQNKISGKYGKAPQKKFHAGTPMERVHVDILGPLTESPSGNKYILMAVDQFTKWLECYPLPDQSANLIAKALIENFFSRFGMPLEIHSDQGANFTGNLFRAMCNQLEIHKTRTTPYRPQSNGQVERYNRTLLNMVRTLRSKNVSEWDMYLPHIASAIRSIENRHTGFTANRLMLGRETTKPVEIMYGVRTSPLQSEGEYLANLDIVMQETHRLARESLNAGLIRQKKDYDIHTYLVSYEVGDFVYKFRSASKIGTSRN